MADTQADQGTQEQVQEQSQETQAPEPQTIPKQRFDEVYQERKRFEEENQRLMSILAAQAEAQQAQAQQRAPAPEPEEPQFDEQTARVVDAIERRIFKKLEPRGKQTQSAYDMAERADFYASYVATGQIDRKMAERVEQLVGNWRRGGDTRASRKDALYMLMGYDTLQSASTPQNDLASRRAVMGSGGGEGPPPPARQKDYDSLPKEKQMSALEKDLDGIKF